MKRWIMVGLLSGLVAGLITGCEWTTGGGVDSWSGRYNWVNFSGVYRKSATGVLVSDYSSGTVTEIAGTTPGSGGGGSSSPIHTETFALGSSQVSDMRTLHYIPIVIASIVVNVSDGKSLTDADGDGVLTQVSGPAPAASGTIDYNAGVLSLVFPVAPGGSYSVTYTHSTSPTPGGNTASSGVLSKKPIVPGSLSMAVGDSFVLRDNGSGGLSGSGLTGTIDYNTGAWTIDYGTATVPANAQIVAAYQVSGGDRSGTTGAAIYSFTVYQEGEKLRIVDNNGREYIGQFGGVRTTFGGDDTSTSLPVQGDTVIAQYSAEGVSAAGLNVSMVGTMQGTVANNYLSSRTMLGTWIEEGGREGEIHGIADALAIDTSTTTTETEETTTE